MSAPVDVGIITIIAKEIDAIFGVLKIDSDRDVEAHGPLRCWRSSVVSRIDNRPLNLAVSFVAGTAGNIESAVLATLMQERLKPRLMCLVGIAAGALGKTAIGDVVVPDVIHDVTVTVRSGKKTLPRQRSYVLDGRLTTLLKLRPLSERSLRSALTLPEEEIESLRGKAAALGFERAAVSHPPSIKDGSLISGNTLLRDSRYFPSFHSSSDERSKAAEMEAAGFSRACEVVGCPWIVFRGVSDFGDERKDDTFQRYAAHSAAVTLKEFLVGHWQVDEFPRIGDKDTLLADTLEQSLADESVKRNWAYVVEVGRFLSRPLWLSGKLEMRRQIGELVENAAANCNKDSDRAVALVDDIGWTCAVLGDTTRAKKSIKDGLRLAVELEDWYLCAKASRHLASIARTAGSTDDCRLYLERAQSYANKIPLGGRRKEMLASLVLSTAKLMAAEGDHHKAVQVLEGAKDGSADDPLRRVKVFHPLGRALLALGDHKGAVYAFTEGYEVAVRCGRKDEAYVNASALALALEKAGENERARAWATIAIRLAADLSDYPIAPGIVALASEEKRP